MCFDRRRKTRSYPQDKNWGFRWLCPRFRFVCMNATVPADFHRDGIRALRYCEARSAHQLAAERDVSLSTAQGWKRAAHRFLGPADSKAKQARALEACERLGHSLERLLMIDSHAKRATSRGMGWSVRLELCLLDSSFSDAKAHAIELINKIVAPTPPKRGLHASRSRLGVRTLTWRTSERAIGDLLLALDNDIECSRASASAAPAPGRDELESGSDADQASSGADEADSEPGSPQKTANASKNVSEENRKGRSSCSARHKPRSDARGEALHRLLFGDGSAGSHSDSHSSSGSQESRESTWASYPTGSHSSPDPRNDSSTGTDFGPNNSEPNNPAAMPSCPKQSCSDSGSRPVKDPPESRTSADSETPSIVPSGSGKVSVPALRTMVIVGVEDYVKILAGEGDEVTLALTDGTTMSGAEYLQRLLKARSGGDGRESDVQFALFHPTRGGVNTYTARFANTKQRDLALAEHPVCAWPGCHVPGYLCQIHHLQAHKHGGSTEPANLAPLCAYHNGCNNDDPHAPPRRGRMLRHDGGVVRRNQRGDFEENTHPASRLGAVRIICRAAAG